MALLIAGCVAHVATTEQSSNARVGVGAQSRSPLAGVWKVLELSSRTRTGPSPPRRNEAFKYLHAQVLQLHVCGRAGPLRLFASGPNQPSEANKTAANHSIVAGSATYILDGTTLTMTAILHKNPNEMTGEPLKYSVEIESNRLRMTIANLPFAPGSERRTLLTRIESDMICARQLHQSFPVGMRVRYRTVRLLLGATPLRAATLRPWCRECSG